MAAAERPPRGAPGSRAAGARPLVVGLTGGLACGKTTVLELFRSLGAATIDADRLAREVLAPGSAALARARALLGDDVVRADGSLDRARTAALVFADAAKRKALEAIVHPEVIAREDAAIERLAGAGSEVIVVDVPLLIEAGRAPRFDRLVVAACPEAAQVARAVARGMTEDDARRRIAAQMPVAEKAARADYVVDTAGTIDETRERARAVFARLREDLDAIRRGAPLAARRQP